MLESLLASKNPKYSLAVSEEYRFVWFKVRKCASSSIRKLLPQPLELLPTRSYQPGRFADYFKFAFVRNPFDRLVSNYNNKIRGKKREEIRPGYIKHLNFREGMTFDEFARQVCALPDHKCDRHYASMHTLFDVNQVDFIGKLENFDEDIRKVLTRIGYAPDEIPHANRTGKAKHVEMYSEDLRELVSRRFARDLELFSYEFGD